MKVEFEPVGIIHSPFADTAGMPVQPTGAVGIEGTVEIYEPFVPALTDLEGFSHVVLLYHFHRSSGYSLQVVPFLDTKLRGLFATRAPRRPNAIGLSVVELDRIENGVLHIRNVDILDGTPLLDIKPYVPAFDAQEKIRTGWLEQAGKGVEDMKSDDRFLS